MDLRNKLCYFLTLSSLLLTVTGTMPEMLLNIVREEVARSEGQKWRRCIERVSLVM